MHRDTGTSFEEVTPPNSSSVEELNIKPCVGMEYESIEKGRNFIVHLPRRVIWYMCLIR